MSLAIITWPQGSVQVEGSRDEVTAYFEARGCTIEKPRFGMPSMRDMHEMCVYRGRELVARFKAYWRRGGFWSVQYRPTDLDPGDEDRS